MEQYAARGQLVRPLTWAPVCSTSGLCGKPLVGRAEGASDLLDIFRQTKEYGSDDVTVFRETGFVLLQSAFDPTLLSDEIDRAFAEQFSPASYKRTSFPRTGDVRFRYLPMIRNLGVYESAQAAEGRAFAGGGET